MTLEAALAKLLAAWRESRSAEVAALIERVSARLARPPITGGSQRALHEAWLAVRAADDPLDVDRLVALLPHGNLTMARARIAALATLPPDPRVAAGLEAMIASPPSVAFVKSSSLAMWNELFDELARIADPRTRKIAERLPWLAHDRATSPFDAGPLRARTSSKLAAIADTIRRAAAPTPALRALCDEVEALLRATPMAAEPGAALLAKIYADPHDLGARAVYGDWLSEQGDPRGELIALQLARAVHDELDVYHGERKLSSRERTLLRTHQSVWVGPLGALLKDITFERGFPYRGTLARNVRIDALAIREASTLAHLSLLSDHGGGFARLAAPPFHGLVSVQTLPWSGLEALARARPVPTIRSVRVDADDGVVSFAALDTPWPLERLELRTLDEQSSTGGILELMRTPLVHRLRALRVAYQGRNDRGYLAGFVASNIQRLELETWSYVFELAVERDADGQPRTRITIRYTPYPGNRASIVPLMRERAATWPRDLVDTALVEIDADFAREAPEERAQILAAAAQFAAELEVTETTNAAR